MSIEGGPSGSFHYHKLCSANPLAAARIREYELKEEEIRRIRRSESSWATQNFEMLVWGFLFLLCFLVVGGLVWLAESLTPPALLLLLG